MLVLLCDPNLLLTIKVKMNCRKRLVRNKTNRNMGNTGCREYMSCESLSSDAFVNGIRMNGEKRHATIVTSD